MKANPDTLSNLLDRFEANVLYVDNHLLVVSKPAGWLAQGDGSGRPVLLDLAKEWVKRRYDKPGAVYLGLVHRLDKPVSGVMVLARTSKAASRLSAQFRARSVVKEYWAVAEGEVPAEGCWETRLLNDASGGGVKSSPTGKPARLRFRRLAYEAGLSWVEVWLETGRRHQIRVQFSTQGFPLLGDGLYGARQTYAPEAIALHARALTIEHPVLREVYRFEALPEEPWPSAFLPAAGAPAKKTSP